MSWLFNHKIYLLILSSILFLGGCSSRDIDKYDIVKDFEIMVFEKNENIYEVREFIDGNIENIKDIDISSSMVNTYIYSLYQNIDKYANVVSIFNNELYEIKEELGVDTLTESNISMIPKEYKIIRSVLEEIFENDYMLIDNGVNLVDVDIEKISNRYLEYINKDTLSYLNFRMDERSVEIYDANSDKYNIELLLDVLNRICDSIESLEGNSQIENWIDTLSYYLDIILSKNHTKFINSDGLFDNNIYNEMKGYIVKYNNSKFGKFMEEYLNELDKNDMDIDSEGINELLLRVDTELNSYLMENK